MTETAAPAAPRRTVTWKQFDELAEGDRVETWDGILGTVTAVEFHTRPIWDGSDVAFEATLTIHSTMLKTFDAWGWPKWYEGDVTRRVRKYSTDLRLHYV